MKRWKMNLLSFLLSKEKSPIKIGKFTSFELEKSIYCFICLFLDRVREEVLTIKNPLLFQEIGLKKFPRLRSRQGIEERISEGTIANGID